MSDSIQLSIVICTSSGARSLRQTIVAVLKCDFPAGNTELIIVDNTSGGVIRPILDKYSNSPLHISCVHEPVAGLSMARNAGVRAAQGDIIIFTDDDVLPSKDWALKLTAPILAGKADATTGKITLAPSLRRDWQRPMHLAYLAVTTHKSTPVVLIGASFAFHRRVLACTAGFDTNLGAGRLGGGEEVLFSYQLANAAYRIVYVPEAEVEHHPNADRLERKSWKKRAQNAGRSQAYIAYHWGNHGSLTAPVRLIQSLARRCFLALQCVGHRRFKAPATEAELQAWSDVAFYWQLCLDIGKRRRYRLPSNVERLVD